ncbi:MAG: peptide-methionine (S)-S-oxide reductase MsrA [Candidatus Cyclobacteriaceae bacterium M2_1C_046]
MKNLFLLIAITFGIILSCESQRNSSDRQKSNFNINPSEVDTATFAGGCFWCVEAVFDRTAGVVEAVSGYSGGDRSNATYDKVSRGLTDHAEAVQIYYKPEEITYDELLEIFFATHNPTQLNRQGPDIGEQYRTAIFYHDQEQKRKAENYMQKLEKAGKYEDPIVTELNELKAFYIAEDYHQDYYDAHPNNPYIVSVTKPKIEKFEKEFRDRLKPQYR